MKGVRKSGRKSRKSNNNDNNAPVAVESEEKPALEEVVEEKPALEEVVEEKPALEEVAEEKPALEEVVEEKPALEEVVEEKPALEEVAEQDPPSLREILVMASPSKPAAKVFYRNGNPYDPKDLEKDDEKMDKFAWLVHFDDGSMGKLLCGPAEIVSRGEYLAKMRSQSKDKQILFSHAERISE